MILSNWAVSIPNTRINCRPSGAMMMKSMVTLNCINVRMESHPHSAGSGASGRR